MKKNIHKIQSYGEAVKIDFINFCYALPFSYCFGFYYACHIVPPHFTNQIAHLNFVDNDDKSSTIDEFQAVIQFQLHEMSMMLSFYCTIFCVARTIHKQNQN